MAHLERAFQACDSEAEILRVSLLHSNKPIHMTPLQDEAFKQLLWYMPCFTSFQSTTHPLYQAAEASDTQIYKNPTYDGCLFSILLDILGIDDSDCRVFGSEAEANAFIVENRFAKGDEVEFCPNRQKLVFFKSNGDRTRFAAILRHLRNCIAHGRFNLVGKGYCVGIDKNRDLYTAYLSFDTARMAKALKRINRFSTWEDLIGIALEKQGYQVVRQESVSSKSKFSADLIAERQGIKYYLELKRAQKPYRVPQDKDLKMTIRMLQDAKQDDPESKYIILFDANQLSKDARARAHMDEVTILDRNDVKKLLSGVDVLSETKRA